MKIALVLGGIYREFEDCYSLVKDTIPPNTDIFFSTWTESRDYYKDSHNEIVVHDEKVSEKLIHSINKDIKCLLLDEKSTKETVSEVKIGDTIVTYKEPKGLYHWKTAFNHFDLSKYDCIILSRPDQYVDYSEALKSYKEDSLFYLQRLESGLVDRFLMGSYDNISKFIQEIDTKDSSGIHIRFENMLDRTETNYEQLDVDHVLIRLNYRVLRNSDKTLEKAKEKQGEYWTYRLGPEWIKSVKGTYPKKKVI